MRKRSTKRLGLEGLEAREVPAVFASTTGAVFQVSQPLTNVVQQPTTFTDDFADGTSLGAQWQGRVGSFVASGSKAVAATSGTSLTTLQAVATRDAAVQGDIAIRAGSGESVGLVARYSGPGESNFYLAEAYGTPGAVTLSIYRNHAGRYTRLATAAVADATGTLRFEADGSNFRLSLNGELKVSASDGLLDGAGTVGIRANGPRNAVSLDNFSFERLATPDATLGVTDAFSTARLGREYVTQVGDVLISGGQAANGTGTALATLRGVSLRDQVVAADVDVADRSGASVGLVARYSGPGESNFYLAEVYADARSAGVRVSIYLRQGHAYRLLASNTVAGGVTGKLTFEVIGGSQRVYLGDTLLASARDTTLDGAGSAGFRLNGAVGAARLDNFSAAAPPAATSTTLPFSDSFASAVRGRLGTMYSEKAGSLRVADGKATGTAGLDIAVLNGVGQADMAVKADVALTPGSGQSVGLLGRYTGEGEGTGYLAEAYAAPGMGNAVAVNIYRRFGGQLLRLATAATTQAAGTLEFRLSGPSLSVSLGGQTLLEARDTLLERGTAGLRLSGPAGSVRNFSVADVFTTSAAPAPEPTPGSSAPAPYSPVPVASSFSPYSSRSGGGGTDSNANGGAFTAKITPAQTPGVTVTQVAFYLDADTDGALNPAADSLLGYGRRATLGGVEYWELGVGFDGWTPGSYRAFAQAKDNSGLLSQPTAIDFTVKGSSGSSSGPGIIILE